MRMRTITCGCCGLHRRVRDNDGDEQPTICRLCTEHRGVNLSERRATEHEALLREYLTAATESADKAYRARDNYQERMRSAYGSRERSLRILARVSNLHTLKGNGSCTCGIPRGCRVAEVMQDRWVVSQLDKLAQRDEAVARELGYADPPDADWIVNEWDRLDGPGYSSGVG